MKYFLLPILLLFFGSATLAQTNIISSGTDSLMFKNQGIKSMVIAPDGTVRIGTVKAMDNSALLQINSNTKGLLIPSLTTAQRDAIAGPANGLLIYNVTTSEFNYYNGSAWSLLYPSNSVWRLTGNAGTVDGTNFIGTTDNVPLSFRVNNALAGKVTSDGNSFFGYQSGNANVGYYNTGVGLNALNLNTTGNDNTAVGVYSLSFNSTGTDNAAIGFGSLASNVSGNANTASGSYSLYSNVAGSGATAIGKGAMYYANNAVSPFTNYNVALGFEALRGSTDASANTGNNNTALGYQTLRSNTTGDNNTASGLSSLSSNTMGQYNTASGVQSLYNNTTGSNNTASGSYSLFGNTTGCNNNALGYLADVGSNNLTNATAIGAMAYVTTNNSMVLGSINGVNGAIANTNVGIGTTAPSQALSVAEKFQVNASGNIIKLNNVTTSFPAAQGGANTVLTNNGSGGLTWASVTGTLSGGSNNYLTKWSGANTATTSVLYDNGTNVGLGTASPTSLFSVGASSQFQVNSSGNIVKINNLTTSFPAAQGGANTVLTNNGSGGLT
ncbi:MAG: hypothetical protein IT239_02145, partial [Bacteroidia bacterium]|nr:hypothetical protein [Bacteroidia bacterium]